MGIDWLTAMFDEPVLPGDVDVLRVSRRAMATTFEVLLPVATPFGQIAALAALDLIDELEDQLSVYRPTSEVSQLNALAATEPVTVEPRLFHLLEQAAYLTRETDGAFDIATGALSVAWGFYQRQGRVPTPAEQADAMGRSGMRFVVLDRAATRVRYLRAGLQINLGGIGKGYALDRAAALLRDEWGIKSALLHGGTSSVYALGTPPGQERGWPIRIKHPWEAGQFLGTLYLRDAGMGTSAATFQHFTYNTRTLGHLLDPRTGWPAEQMQQVSVVAQTATEADALSTAFFVLGVEPTARFCFTHPHVAALSLPLTATQPVAWNFDSARLVLSLTGP